jgi:hypothetical protein
MGSLVKVDFSLEVVFLKPFCDSLTRNSWQSFLTSGLALKDGNQEPHLSTLPIPYAEMEMAII